MKRHTIQLYPLGKTLRVNHNTPLMDVLHEYGIEFPCGGKGSCGKCKVKVLKGDVKVSELHRQKLELLGLTPEWRLACYSQCKSDITVELDQFNQLILADESSFEFTPKQGYGVAVDLGTTTLVAQLVDLSNASVLAVETRLNPQARFGADVISRIQSCLDGNAREMTRLIRLHVGNMIELLQRKTNVELQQIAIVGNTVMHHIFCGIDVKPLAEYPFHSTQLQRQIFSPEMLEWNFRVNDFITFYPSVGSFVGSDIVAGILATGIDKHAAYTALIDLGTNGEIVIGNKERLVCASTAAGPAFEGTNISVGMRAVTGAVSSFHRDEEKLIATVIGNAKARGLCGSALVDAIALLRKTEQIGLFGEIADGTKQLELVNDISLTQKDIHEFQLAKAAIAAGMEILCSTLAISDNELQAVYIAGGFGTYLNVEHLIQTGALAIPTVKIHKMGNTALIGAKMFLFTENAVIDTLLAKTEHINLESHPAFQDIYVDSMIFP